MAAGLLLAGCAAGSSTAPAAVATSTGVAAATESPSASPSGTPGTVAASASPSSRRTAGSGSPSPSGHPAAGAKPGATTTATTRGGLAGAVVVIDPGHDGGNGRHPEVVNRLVDIGVGRKACDTTGTQTASGYTESAFTWDLAQRLARRLRAAGARVVLTRASDQGVGPCIVERAAIGNRAAAAAGPRVPVVGLSLHADGGPTGGYGFHVIEPGRVAPQPRHRRAVAAARHRRPRRLPHRHR